MVWVLLADSFFGANLRIGDLIGALWIGSVFGYAAAFVLGVPTHHILRLFHRTSIVHYALVGLAMGTIVAEVFQVGFIHAAVATYRGLPRGFQPFAGILFFELPFALAGSVAATAFWFVARPDRADQISANYQHPD